jgi:phosphatidylserine decarboxylase
MRFAKEAWPFVLPFEILALGLLALSQPGWAAASAVVGLLVLLFFRDPRRRFEGDEAIVLAPADGLITSIEELEDAAVGPGRYRRVVTFLSVFDVHVQRVPTAGRIVASTLTRGRKVAAFRANAGAVNERHLNVVETADGARIGVYQIAGLLARRVVSYLGAGQSVQRGQHLGVIKFGSRVDLLVPAHYEILVQKGERVRNGETPMARKSAAPRG